MSKPITDSDLDWLCHRHEPDYHERVAEYQIKRKGGLTRGKFSSPPTVCSTCEHYDGCPNGCRERKI